MKFVINARRWRCGMNGDPSCKLGEGDTKLLNTKGYMCCLGQIAMQLGVPEEKLLGVIRPAALKMEVEYLTEKYDTPHYYNSTLAIEAMAINDREYTSILQKELALQELFKEHGHEIVFVDE